MKKAALLFILVAFIITFYGCQTVKDAGETVKKADESMQKVLW